MVGRRWSEYINWKRMLERSKALAASEELSTAVSMVDAIVWDDVDDRVNRLYQVEEYATIDNCKNDM